MWHVKYRNRHSDVSCQDCASVSCISRCADKNSDVMVLLVDAKLIFVSANNGWRLCGCRVCSARKKELEAGGSACGCSPWCKFAPPCLDSYVHVMPLHPLRLVRQTFTRFSPSWRQSRRYIRPCLPGCASLPALAVLISNFCTALIPNIMLILYWTDIRIVWSVYSTVIRIVSYAYSTNMKIVSSAHSNGVIMVSDR